eukprot:8685219-Pyramimonas_sp.AAC.1
MRLAERTSERRCTTEPIAYRLQVAPAHRSAYHVQVAHAQSPFLSLNRGRRPWHGRPAPTRGTRWLCGGCGCAKTRCAWWWCQRCRAL